MKMKFVLLTLLFSIGFSFYNCSTDHNCPVGEREPFFDIKDLTLVTYNYLNEDAAIPFEDLCIKIQYIVEYHSFQEPTNWNFSLMNSALACSYIPNGYKGSETEMLKELTVITLNDFDADHLKNDTINDLLEIGNNYEIFEPIAIDEYLLQDTANIQSEILNLFLTKAPELDSTYHFKVMIELSNGERYEVESEPVVVE